MLWNNFYVETTFYILQDVNKSHIGITYEYWVAEWTCIVLWIMTFLTNSGMFPESLSENNCKYLVADMSPQSLISSVSGATKLSLKLHTGRK